MTTTSSSALAASSPPRAGMLALDGVFWRRAAHVGARRAPGWFVRWAPPLIGAFIALLSPGLRRRISAQLARVRGPVGPLRDALDVAKTFATFAICLTELLARGSRNDPGCQVSTRKAEAALAVLSGPTGVIFATAHTAGWESLAGLLSSEHTKPVVLVMQRERDPEARRLQDGSRKAPGRVDILHVGGDPLAALQLARQLRDGGVVALQIDRVPAGMAGHEVQLFGAAGAIPEGPLRLAQLTGAPIVPVFSERTGPRRYCVHVGSPLFVERGADRAAVHRIAQTLADALSGFVRAHPTQWFPFRD